MREHVLRSSSPTLRNTQASLSCQQISANGSGSYSLVLEVWFCRICGSVCVLSAQRLAWKWTDNKTHDKEKSRHMPNKREYVCREQNCISLYFNALVQDWSQKGFWCWKTIRLSSLVSPVSYNCTYKSGAHDFLHCLGPHVPAVTENHLGRKYYSLSGSSFLIKLIRSGDISSESLLQSCHQWYEIFLLNLWPDVTRVQVPKFEREWRCQRNVLPESN